MKIKNYTFIAFLFVVFALNAQQKKDKILMHIDDDKVYVSEFLRVYNKNKDVVAEENKKNIHEYLDLFINYKLKLREAKDLKLDTVPSYLSEFNKYKNQLIEPYLKDREVTNKLVLEAYNRMTKEVNASHILITAKPNDKPQDTLKAYNKALELRELIIKGASFEEIAKKHSQDPSAKQNGGNLGYFTAFSMVYAFENAAYTTKVGDVSMPFRTKFGYHILKVKDKRESKGEIKVAHIMIRDKKTEPAYAEKQIKDIYQKFKQGETFEFLAKKYSDDKTSAVKGGVIRKFSLGKMIQPFADVSFSLQNVDDVSEPFKTKFGWHIVKLIKKYPIASFEELKEVLVKKIEKGERSVLIGNSIANRLKDKYVVKQNKEVLHVIAQATKVDTLNAETILSIENETYKVTEFRKYLSKNKGKGYDDFVNAKIIAYYKNNLENENKQFAATLQEYRDGLLLFDLLQKKIWTKAEKDSVGLQDFFTKNASNYVWKERVHAVIASCTKLEKATLVEQLLREGKTIDEIKKAVNEGATIHVLFNSGDFELDSKKLPVNFIAEKGVKLYKEEDNHFSVVNVKKLLEASPKQLSDVRGKVISNYQDYLEKRWIKDLREKYTVKVKKKTFKKLAKQYR